MSSFRRIKAEILQITGSTISSETLDFCWLWVGWWRQRKMSAKMKRYISKLQNGINILSLLWISFLIDGNRCNFWGVISGLFCRSSISMKLTFKLNFLIKIACLFLLRILLHHYICLLSSVFMNVWLKIWNISAFNMVRNVFFWKIGLIK